MTVEEIYKYIDVNPLRGGEPVFWGTKLSVSHILEDLQKGMSNERILSEHPELTLDHLVAALVFAKHFPTDEELLLYIATSLFR